MISERHNIACRLIMKAIEAGSLGGCFVQMDTGSKDRLALQNLQIPGESTNRTVPIWLFPCRSPSKQRFTTNRSGAILVTEMPTKKSKYQMSNLDMHKEVGQGAEGMGGSQQQHQPTSLRPESGTPVSSHPISGTSILWRSSTTYYYSSTVKIPGLGASLKPLTTSSGCSVNTFAELRPMLASTLSFWEWEVPSTALKV